MQFFGRVREAQNAMRKTSSRYTVSSFICSGTSLSQAFLLQLEMAHTKEAFKQYPLQESAFFVMAFIMRGLKVISYGN